MAEALDFDPLAELEIEVVGRRPYENAGRWVLNEHIPPGRIEMRHHGSHFDWIFPFGVFEGELADLRHVGQHREIVPGNSRSFRSRQTRRQKQAQPRALPPHLCLARCDHNSFALELIMLGRALEMEDFPTVTICYLIGWGHTVLKNGLAC